MPLNVDAFDFFGHDQSQYADNAQCTLLIATMETPSLFCEVCADFQLKSHDYYIHAQNNTIFPYSPLYMLCGEPLGALVADTNALSTF